MRMHGTARIQCVIGILISFSLGSAVSADAAKGFRISAVQDNQVWIEGGLIDGLGAGLEGKICYEIRIAGQKKRITPAKIRLIKAEDNESIGILYDQLGIINVGYSAYFVPKPANDLLLLFNERATKSYAEKDFRLAKQYYQRILDVLPGDPFATQKIKDCEAQIEEQDAVRRERRNIPYYREVIRTAIDSGDPDSLKLAQTYVNKILAVDSEDDEALKLKEKLERPALKPPHKKAEINLEQVPQPVETPVTRAAKVKAPASKPVPLILPESSPETKQSSILDNMIRIPEGDFPIGTPSGKSRFKNEIPKHSIHLAAYYIDKYEVTNEEYKRFCDETGHPYPNHFSGNLYPPGTAKSPVVMVSWTDADAYAKWAGKRLPTEAEWEAAAAGFSGRKWPWGNQWVQNEANTRELGEKAAAIVGSHPFDVSEFGIYDMAGNVSEWTQSWYRPYPGNAGKEKEYGEQYKVLRGGSSQASKDFARAQFRARLPQSYRSLDLGFRCAISAGDVD